MNRFHQSRRLAFPRTKSLGAFHGLRVYAVDGEAIRGNREHKGKDVDFTMGGTVRRWKFIPDGEIWIDECLSELDRQATIQHEFKEYCEMTERGLSYEVAHDKANVVERKYRREGSK